MARKAVIKLVQHYLKHVSKQGVPANYGVLFGSYAQGKANELSASDVLVVSPKFDEQQTHVDDENLFIYAGRTDSRVEPILVGEKQFAGHHANMIIETARREGQIMPLAD